MTTVSLGYSLLALVLFFFASVWWACARYTSNDRLYCLQSAAYTLCWSIGVILISLRWCLPEWVGYSLSNFVILLGFVYLVLSIETYYRLESSRLSLIFLLVFSALLLIIIGPTKDSQFDRLVVLGSSSGLCCIIAMKRGLKPLWREHGTRVAWAMGFIGIIATSLWILRVEMAAYMQSNELDLIAASNFNLYALYLIWLIAICFQGSMLFLLITRNARKIEALSTKDFLTGAHNRLGLEKVWQRILDTHKTLAVVILDIDHFKKINDTHGHDVGDQILKLVVARTHGVLRQEDKLARFGGEEFVIILPGADVEQAVRFAERVRVAIETDHFQLRDVAISVTASFGVAGQELVGDRGDLYELVRVADEALYHAKGNGRNRVVMAESQMVTAEC